MAKALVKELSELLLALAPYTLTDEHAEGNWAMDFGPLSSAQSDAPDQHEFRQFGLMLEGQTLFGQLVALLRARPEGRDRWGSESLQAMAQVAVGAVAFDYRTPDAAAEALARLLESQPPERQAIAPVRGLRIVSRADLCGLRLRPHNLAPLCDELGIDTAQRLDLERRFAANQLGFVTLACRADEEVAAIRLRERLHLALPILLLSQPDNPEWLFDGSVILGGQEVLVVPSVEAGRIADGHLPMQSVADLEVDGPRLHDALAERPGLRRIEALASRLPLLPKGRISRRLVRAARLLGEAFEGPYPDRFIRRWMALEALLGDGRSELSERLCERIAVLSDADVADRAERKKTLRDLYDRRSRYVHGGDLELDEYSASWFRMIAVFTLERVAETQLEDDDALFALLENAKFAGAPVDVQAAS